MKYQEPVLGEMWLSSKIDKGNRLGCEILGITSQEGYLKGALAGPSGAFMSNGRVTD